MKEQYDSVIDMMDKEQLESTSKNINIRKLGADMLPSEFVEKRLADSRDESANAETENPRLIEAEKHTKVHDIDEAKLRRNDGMPKKIR